jgi:hypothetical protein
MLRLPESIPAPIFIAAGMIGGLLLFSTSLHVILFIANEARWLPVTRTVALPRAECVGCL